MRSVQVSKPNGPFEIVERKIPEPEDGKVRIEVQACGICHGDSVTKLGLFPDITISHFRFYRRLFSFLFLPLLLGQIFKLLTCYNLKRVIQSQD